MSMLLMAAMLGMAELMPAAELDYRPGSLAYQALVDGDLRLAERQLSGSNAELGYDPAWLINHAQLLARSGRVNEAREVLRRVTLAPDTEVVLASGEVVGSREASRRALQGLRVNRLTSR
jgi:hypothetical protein